MVNKLTTTLSTKQHDCLRQHQKYHLNPESMDNHKIGNNDT